jgi:hypothetical protein
MNGESQDDQEAAKSVGLEGSTHPTSVVGWLP